MGLCRLTRRLFGTGIFTGMALLGCSSSDPAPMANIATLEVTPVSQAAPEIQSADFAAPQPTGEFELRWLGRHRHGGFNRSAAEICAYETQSRQLFVVNAEAAAIDILAINDPTHPELVKSVPLSGYGSKPNSVAIHAGKIAVAMSAAPQQSPGSVVWLSKDGNVTGQLTVGAQPDLLTFSPDGRWLLTADEGEPSDDYANDPVGSVSLIEIPDDGSLPTQSHVTTLGFDEFEDRPALDASLRIYGPGATVAQDLEPEYIAVSADSSTAWVSLQEANALAKINLRERRIERLIGLGFKDHSQPELALDVSDRDGGIRIQPWPVKGMYQPDAIRTFSRDGETWIISANEGDHRKYAAFSEEARVQELCLDPRVFVDAETLQRPDQLGRLLVTKSLGDADGDGLYEELYCLGGRSFAIWDVSGKLVFDSGSDFEQIVAARHPASFNADHESNETDSRSDNKGPEPEGLALAEIDGRWLAFIGLERHSGIMIYDVTQPRSPVFVNYVVTRDFTVPGHSADAGDLGPEGLTVIPAEDSPTKKLLLAVSFEVSGTTTLFEIVGPKSETVAR